MKRLAALLVVAIPAIAMFRIWWNKRVPYYATWAEYVAADAEGDALPPDPYTEAIARRLADFEKTWTAGSAATYELRPWRTTYCAPDCGCAGASLAFLCLFNPECARCHERVYCE